MAWVESVSPSFRARHESGDRDEVERVIEELERLRDRLGTMLPRTPGDVEIIFHGTPVALDVAAPLLPLARRLDAAAARRYRAGAAKGARIDVLAPPALRRRASEAPGSQPMLDRLPAALYARLAVLALNRNLGRPWQARPWAWLLEGAAAWLGGQVRHARPAIGRRLREGPEPDFPPARADALLLGGTVFDLLEREAGAEAAVALALTPPAGPPRAAATAAFSGRTGPHTESAWRSHLVRLAGRPDEDGPRPVRWRR